MKLLPVEEARARMLAASTLLPTEVVDLALAPGRVLGEDVTAIRDQPPFPASAMDGWAVRAAETPGALRIAGESAAGHAFEGELGPGQAVRIFTGAAVPAGADAIVIQEDAERDGEIVRAPATPKGQHLRPAGGDFHAGEVLLTRGARIDPWRLSLAAAAGRATLSVARRPRVSLFSTGEEIIEAPAIPGPFQIYDSGSRALVALAEGWGAMVTRTKPVRDDLDATIAALEAAEGDLVVTVGGASVGDHDLVRAAADALGLDMRVASVNVRPGKPTFFGVLGDGRLMLGLPGNPASALVCAELFLRPLLDVMQGAAPRALAKARLARPIGANGPREHWMRARLANTDGALTVQPAEDQDSSLVSVFAAADALLRRPAGAAAAETGAVVEVLPLARA
jgi:molybdopterin molybdotransferase